MTRASFPVQLKIASFRMLLKFHNNSLDLFLGNLQWPRLLIFSNFSNSLFLTKCPQESLLLPVDLSRVLFLFAKISISHRTLSSCDIKFQKSVLNITTGWNVRIYESFFFFINLSLKSCFRAALIFEIWEPSLKGWGYW